MEDEMLTISRKGFIEILTKSGRYNVEGIETVLDNGGLACAIEAVMVDIEHEAARSEHYKDRCSRLQGEIAEIGFKVSEVQNDLIDICDDTDCD